MSLATVRPGALWLNVHFHTLVPDGVFVADGRDDDDDGTGALLADAARSPMGTLPFATPPPPALAKRRRSRSISGP